MCFGGNFNTTNVTPADDLTVIPAEFERAVCSLQSHSFLFLSSELIFSYIDFRCPKHGTEKQLFWDQK